MDDENYSETLIVEVEESQETQDHQEEDNSDNTEVTVEELLISCVMARPPLWDSRLPLSERSKSSRDKLWLEIYREFGEQSPYSVEYLMKKWRNLRDTYVRLKGDYETYTPSGSAAKKKKKKWHFYDMMGFLNNTLNYRPTTSNLVASPISDCNQVSPFPSLPQAPIPIPSSTSQENKRKKLEGKNIEGAIINALNKINSEPTSDEVIPICRTISDLLSKMPLRERTQLEIALLQTTYEAAYKYL